MQELSKKKTSLQIVHEMDLLLAEIVNSGGEITPEIEKQIFDLTQQGKDKVDSCVFFTEMAEKKMEFFKEKAEVFQRTAAGYKKAIDTVKNNLKLLMTSLDINLLEGDVFNYKLVDGIRKLVINEHQLDPQYFIIVTNKEPDKERIKKDLQNGVTIIGASLDNTKSLRKYTNTGR